MIDFEKFYIHDDYETANEGLFGFGKKTPSTSTTSSRPSISELKATYDMSKAKSSEEKQIFTFVNKALKQDSRNYFAPSNTSTENLPKEMQEFYKHANPVDVEIEIDDGMVKFYSVGKVSGENDEYNLGKDRVVFASCNGDPIFIYNKKVYTRPHGVKKENAKDELIASSFFAYLKMLK